MRVSCRDGLIDAIADTFGSYSCIVEDYFCIVCTITRNMHACICNTEGVEDLIKKPSSNSHKHFSDSHSSSTKRSHYLHASQSLSDEDLLSLSSYTPDASGTVYSE